MSDRWGFTTESDQDDTIKTFLRDLSSIERHTIKESKTETTPTLNYTIHDADHCLAVEHMVRMLIKKSGEKKSEEPLTDLEKFILYASVWTHDLGMFQTLAKGYFEEFPHGAHEDRSVAIRERHDEISAWHLSKSYQEIFSLTDEQKKDLITLKKYRNYVNAINLISKYHRTKNDMNECPRDYFIDNDNRIRTALLASFLRFGDTLHVDSSRFDRRFYDVLQIGQMDRFSRLHWLKSYILTNISLEPKKETIHVNIELPQSIKGSYSTPEILLNENIRNLVSIVTNDIINDMLHVRQTFKENDLAAYSVVTPHVNFIPGYNSKDSKEIEGVVSDLGITLSPNTSKVIDTAMESVDLLCTTNFEEHPYQFYSQMNELIKYLRSIEKDKVNHIGLRNVIDSTELIFRELLKNDTAARNSQKVIDCQLEIHTVIEKIRECRKAHSQEIYEKSEKGFLKEKKIENIFLFAYSEMVIRYLDAFGDSTARWRDKVNIYILECGGKRRVTNKNEIEYNDGHYYANQLAKRKFRNLNLLPDTSFGSQLNVMEKEGTLSKTAVLFGVNGFDEKGNCVHDSGHYMIAIIAEYFKVPVYVISDTFKKGEITWDQAAMEKKRGKYWLTGQRNLLDSLKHNNITLINYAEDMIPGRFIKSVITNTEDKGRDAGQEIPECTELAEFQKRLKTFRAEMKQKSVENKK